MPQFRSFLLTTVQSIAVTFAITAQAQVNPTLIDTTPPPFDDPPSPWQSLSDQSVITYTFNTSWDGIVWSQVQKQFMYDAINQIDDILTDQVFIELEPSPDTLSFSESSGFTMRWAGSDLFQDWRDDGRYSSDGWNLGVRPNGTRPLAIAYKHNNAPWDHTRYPNNEIYFNSFDICDKPSDPNFANCPWSFDIFGVQAGKYDFWTVALHEIIHMLASDQHASDPDEVMYPSINRGQRKYPKLSDLEILIGQGYSTDPSQIRTGPVPVPEPTSTLSLLSLGILGAGATLKRKLKPYDSIEKETTKVG